ncbi:hypothetical protein TNCV_1993411 [Trichonephila clavipes]|nr:hypothetical protein TNCV_1993411 [Trichonephila clavipes]
MYQKVHGKLTYSSNSVEVHALATYPEREGLASYLSLKCHREAIKKLASTCQADELALRLYDPPLTPSPGAEMTPRNHSLEALNRPEPRKSDA